MFDGLWTDFKSEVKQEYKELKDELRGSKKHFMEEWFKKTAIEKVSLLFVSILMAFLLFAIFGLIIQFIIFVSYLKN